MRNRILAVCMTGLMLTGMALAQTAQAPVAGEHGHGKRGHGEGRMFKGLNLTPDQQAQVETIWQSERSQMQALRSNTTLTEEQKKQQIRELRQNNHQQMMAVLTPEQQAQLKQRHQGSGKEGFRGGRGFRDLNLTADQKSRLEPIFQSTRQQMQALRADTSLTPEQKHEKMQQIRQNQMTQMKSILTPEQQEKMQQRRGRRFHRGGEKPAAPSGF